MMRRNNRGLEGAFRSHAGRIGGKEAIDIMPAGMTAARASCPTKHSGCRRRSGTGEKPKFAI
jgi:hypothetical protein